MLGDMSTLGRHQAWFCSNVYPLYFFFPGSVRWSAQDLREAQRLLKRAWTLAISCLRLGFGVLGLPAASS